LVLLSVPTPSNYLLNVSTKSQLPVHWVILAIKRTKMFYVVTLKMFPGLSQRDNFVGLSHKLS